MIGDGYPAMGKLGSWYSSGGPFLDHKLVKLVNYFPTLNDSAEIERHCWGLCFG